MNLKSGLLARIGIKVCAAIHNCICKAYSLIVQKCVLYFCC